MLRLLLRDLSCFRSWLAVVLDSSHKLFPGRLAYKHELNPIEISVFDGNHLLIGEGEYGQVYGVKPTVLSPELGNMIKLGTTRYGKSSAELCQIGDWDGSEIIFDIKGEIYPKVAGYLATRRFHWTPEPDDHHAPMRSADVRRRRAQAGPVGPPRCGPSALPGSGPAAAR